jgi:hypothetical protein
MDRRVSYAPATYANVSRVQCAACAASLDIGSWSWSCPRCGYPVRERPRVRLAFTGDAVEAFGWLAFAIPAGLTVFAVPWWIAAVWRWFCRNLIFTDGAAAEFRGRGGEILGWWMLAGLGGSIGWPPILAIRIVSLQNLPATVLFWLIALYGKLRILRWCVAKTRVGAGERFRFYGTYWELAGWVLLHCLAAITIIGWAWTAAAMYRWAARSTRSERRALAFHGEGFEVLWRTVATVLMCVPVLTIPWAVLWYVRWVVANVTIGSHYAPEED